jgi:hypothetical protein
MTGGKGVAVCRREGVGMRRSGAQKREPGVGTHAEEATSNTSNTSSASWTACARELERVVPKYGASPQREKPTSVKPAACVTLGDMQARPGSVSQCCCVRPDLGRRG